MIKTDDREPHTNVIKIISKLLPVLQCATVMHVVCPNGVAVLQQKALLIDSITVDCDIFCKI